MEPVFRITGDDLAVNDKLVRKYCLEQFQDYLVFERNLSENSIAAYCSDVVSFVGEMWCDGVGEPEAVERARVDEYFNRMAALPLAASSLIHS